MNYYEAPDEFRDVHVPSIFLAGGITDCEDWQSYATGTIHAHNRNIVVLNPRRANFPMDDPTASSAQIHWEFRHLHKASVVLFWFPKSPSPQPIAQYELGRYGALGMKLAVGCDSEYSRATDVYEQTRLARPELPIYNNIYSTCQEAISLAVVR